MRGGKIPVSAHWGAYLVYGPWKNRQSKKAARRAAKKKFRNYYNRDLRRILDVMDSDISVVLA